MRARSDDEKIKRAHIFCPRRRGVVVLLLLLLFFSRVQSFTDDDKTFFLLLYKISDQSGGDGVVVDVNVDS